MGASSIFPPAAMGHWLRASLTSSPLCVLAEHALGLEKALEGVGVEAQGWDWGAGREPPVWGWGSMSG